MNKASEKTLFTGTSSKSEVIHEFLGEKCPVARNALQKSKKWDPRLFYKNRNDMNYEEMPSKKLDHAFHRVASYYMDIQDVFSDNIKLAVVPDDDMDSDIELSSHDIDF